MMKLHKLVLVFSVLALIQLSVPCLMWFKQERLIAQGTAYRFRVTLVDPYNPFSGRYVRLALVGLDDKKLNIVRYSRGQKVYLPIEDGADGFQVLSMIVTDNRLIKGPYMIGQINEYGSLELPTEKYFMNEDLAPEAERSMISVKDQKPKAYITIKSMNGEVALTGLFINDQKAEEYVAARIKAAEQERKNAWKKHECI